MPQLTLTKRDRIIVRIITVVGILAFGAYVGERFQPYDLTAKTTHFVSHQVAQSNKDRTIDDLINNLPHQHKVKRGETMSSIARKHHVSLLKLCKANEMKCSESIRPGELITIPQKS